MYINKNSFTQPNRTIYLKKNLNKNPFKEIPNLSTFWGQKDLSLGSISNHECALKFRIPGS